MKCLYAFTGYKICYGCMDGRQANYICCTDCAELHAGLDGHNARPECRKFKWESSSSQVWHGMVPWSHGYNRCNGDHQCIHNTCGAWHQSSSHCHTPGHHHSVVNTRFGFHFSRFSNPKLIIAVVLIYSDYIFVKFCFSSSLITDIQDGDRVRGSMALYIANTDTQHTGHHQPGHGQSHSLVKLFTPAVTN